MRTQSLPSMMLAVIIFWYWESFYNAVGILHSKEILLLRNSLSPKSPSVRSVLIIIFLTPYICCFLGFPFLLLSSALHFSIIFEIMLLCILFKCPYPSETSFFLTKDVLWDINNVSNFQVPIFFLRIKLLLFKILLNIKLWTKISLNYQFRWDDGGK